MTRGAISNLRETSRAWFAAQIAAFAAVLLASLVAVSAPALALKPIEIGQDQGRLDVTPLADLYEGRGDSLQVETAAGADGLASRMSVSAATPGDNPNWIVFALTNSTDKPVERWLVCGGGRRNAYLMDTLSDVLGERVASGEIKPFRRVAIETTGLADPGPVAHAAVVFARLASDAEAALTRERCPAAAVWRQIFGSNTKVNGPVFELPAGCRSDGSVMPVFAGTQPNPVRGTNEAHGFGRD